MNKIHVAQENGAEIFVRRDEKTGALHRVPGFWSVPEAIIIREATSMDVAWIETELDLAAASKDAEDQAREHLEAAE